MGRAWRAAAVCWLRFPVCAQASQTTNQSHSENQFDHTERSRADFTAENFAATGADARHVSLQGGARVRGCLLETIDGGFLIVDDGCASSWIARRSPLAL